MISRSTDVGAARRARQRGFLLNPYRFGPPPATDPNFANVAFLYNGDEANGATAWTDKSGTPKTISIAGSGVTSTTGEAKFGATGLHLPSRAGGLKAGAVADWVFLNGGTKFTGEWWLRAGDFTSFGGILSTCSGSTSNIGIYMGLNTSRQIECYIFFGSVGNLILNAVFSSITFPNDTLSYHFIQLNFDPTLGSNQAQLKIDGGTTASISTTGNTPSGSNPQEVFTLGCIKGSSPNTFWVGGIGGCRITNGVVRSFAVPTAAFPES